jgi:hypothetical protein
VRGGRAVHKLILMDSGEAISRIRPVLQDYVRDRAALTQAQADMLEVRSGR